MGLLPPAAPMKFKLFGPVHIAILCAVPLLATILVAIRRGSPERSKALRTGLAVALLLNTGIWYGYLRWRGWLKFPDYLPLELCDATLCLTVVELLKPNAVVFDLAYCGALAGTSMAVLTPNVQAAYSSFSTVEFFVSHGLVLVSVLYLVGAGEARPRRGSVWRAMLWLNVYAAAVGVFDWVFKTDYMFLRSKPANRSLLDFLGPWPWYIAASELVALTLFSLLYLPFWLSSMKTREDTGAG